ncbi:oxidoreductase [Alcanivorax sp. 1008]|uniref:oxidoreductase n=1 Tax=Alcanivorax sp. 1008 TaxID=2816853 RepID=UPI001DD5ECCC|nr:oxidoreductase [Alcanivorax sp. 1008]MCC1497229.1 oxidoreductase [Alcanivorax sp. 1008]
MSGKKEFTPLQAESFPKHCRICGKVYEDQMQFLTQTTPVTYAPSSIREVAQEDGSHDLYLEVFRHCGCGATLMEFFHSRRDLSEDGITRRQLFDSMVKILEETGQTRQQARAALLERLKAFREN